MEKFIVVVIPRLKEYRIIFEEKFIEGNEFLTQNTIINVLKLFGLEPEIDFICDLCFRHKGE